MPFVTTILHILLHLYWISIVICVGERRSRDLLIFAILSVIVRFLFESLRCRRRDCALHEN
jgi:hypothetical protein